MTFVPHDPTVPNTSTNTSAVDEKTYCAVHPTVETGLRCNKCGRYMCVRCAVKTPVGYRCQQCVHQQQDAFFSATATDYLIAAAVSFVLSLPASYIIPRTFLFGVIIFSLPVGAFIGEAVYRTTKKRRGRYTWVVAAVGIIVGALVANFALFQNIIFISGRPGALGFAGGELLLPLVYVVLCAGGAAARLRYGGK